MRLSAAAVRMASSHQARTLSESASATASAQFMPERSLMYFFILETTMRISASTPSARVTDEDVAAGDGEASAMMRRRGASPLLKPDGDDEADDENDVVVEGDGVSEGVVVTSDCGGVPIGEGEEEKPVAVEDVTVEGVAAGRTIGAAAAAGRAANAEDEEYEDDDGDEDEGGDEDEAPGRPPPEEDSRASSSCHAWRLGLRASTAQDSRWRASATWLSQQDTEQNTRRVRLRLQVDTLQTQWIVEKPISLRQALHLSQKSLIGSARCGSGAPWAGRYQPPVRAWRSPVRG